MCGIAFAKSLHDVYNISSNQIHRGAHSSGLMGKRRDGKGIDIIVWEGPFDKFSRRDLENLMPANEYSMFAGHNRYTTVEGNDVHPLDGAHPRYIGGRVYDYGNHRFIKGAQKALVHNGQVPLENPVSDSQGLLEFYSEHGIKDIVKEIRAAYTYVLFDIESTSALLGRDQLAMRPGVIALKDGAICAASETHPLVDNGAIIRDFMTPGTVYRVFDDGTLTQETVFKPTKRKMCFVEGLYFMDPRSQFQGFSVHSLRMRLGEQLALENTDIGIDFVTHVPHTPEFITERFAETLGVEFKRTMYKMKTERAFMQRTQNERRTSFDSNVHIDPNALSFIQGATIGVIDDCIIRGTNSAAAIQKMAYLSFLEQAGAKKIIFGASAPLFGVFDEQGQKTGCEYGININPNADFLARDDENNRNRTMPEIIEKLSPKQGNTTLDVRVLSTEGLLKVFDDCGIDADKLCLRCIGGKKPF